MAATTTERELTPEFLDSIHESFTSDSKNLLAVNACVRNDVHEVLTAHSVTRGDTSHHTFSHVVSGECKAADQKSSGRCWIFACLGVIRRDIIKEHDLPADWELSQTHLFFWDKVERCNHFLEVMISTLDEDVDSRLQHHLLSDPINDGGQWDMLANLINKYGLVPKTAMPEAWTSCASRKLNWLLANKLREFASVFRTQCGVTDGEDTFAAKAARGHKVRTLKAEMMEELYRIICIHLGTPVTKFDWSVRSKDGKSFKRYTGLTPKTFAEKFVKFDVNDYVSVINDPRNEYGQMYTVAHLGNVVGGAPFATSTRPSTSSATLSPTQSSTTSRSGSVATSASSSSARKASSTLPSLTTTSSAARRSTWTRRPASATVRAS
ncbi:uncharacterized protein AMSG_09432 [Thecamonas trahens ATCC 50062]|uniref:bleomycin hydrolase n=1 Tax=Thecamonas trahens ATCC 50062 TaxID=461836 RepID=A0A0L0DLF0_THETB|nr:hypothetical protein AMSG_09432 [Thecamonas trahens ATCC 50062]KNC53127.1 hypothetical protein AMSG_09432 [Thecamonas trahens ATCC 50062]|eukprot:XP_013754794.1 hypothetical protein AMSG_09432 [Thecamonas trahens ATCC 50062]